MKKEGKAIVQNPNDISRIASDMSVTQGEISLVRDIRIDGHCDGNITSKARIIIGETANVKGKVICNNLDVWGNIEGEIIVRDCISLKKGCSVTGLVRTANIVSEYGAKLCGDTKIIETETFDELCKGIKFLEEQN